MCKFCFDDRASPWEQFYRLLEGGAGLGIPALLLKNQPKPGIGLREILIHLDSLLYLIEGLVVLVRVQVMPAEVDIEENIGRLKLQTAAAFIKGLFSPPHSDQVVRVVVMSFSISWVQLA